MTDRNRRIRTRTSGGVGGVGSNPAPTRFVPDYDLIIGPEHWEIVQIHSGNAIRSGPIDPNPHAFRCSDENNRIPSGKVAKPSLSIGNRRTNPPLNTTTALPANGFGSNRNVPLTEGAKTTGISSPDWSFRPVMNDQLHSPGARISLSIEESLGRSGFETERVSMKNGSLLSISVSRINSRK